jgi:hypothetical protein
MGGSFSSSKGNNVTKICDGCGAVADDKHIHERIKRLEWSTRFRPVHIQVLLVAGVPPARMVEYFYRPAKDRSLRSRESRAFFDQLMKASGNEAAENLQEESALINFQRRGLFLAYAVECPIEAPSAPADALRQLFPTLLKRIQFSYRPKNVALLSGDLSGLIPLFHEAGWGERLILDQGLPFRIETRGGSPGGGASSGDFGERLAPILG